MNNERYFALGTLALSVVFSTGVVQIPNNYVEDFSPYNNYISVITEPSTYNNIVIFNKSQENLKEKSKKIAAYTKDKKILIQIFNSTVEAAQWCFDNNKCSVLSSGVRAHIAEVANGKRKSAYGYYWQYI